MTEPSKVLFLAHTGQVSGAEKVLLDLVGEARRSGREVIVACPSGRLSEALPEGVRHVPIAQLGLGGERGVARAVAAVRLLYRWVAASLKLRTLIRSDDTDTVVNSLFALPVARFARPARGASWLVHDTMTSSKQRAVVKISRRGIRLAVAVSDATAVPLRAAGVPVVVSHNGVTWPVPQFGGELHDPPVVGMLALLTEWKGHRVLLDAAAMLPGVRIDLAGGNFPGDAEYVTALKARAEQHDLAGRVHFLGHCAPEDALRRWDIVVSASTSPEAGPLSVLEAMSHGIPVVGTDHGGTSEFLTGGAGILVEPGNAAELAQALHSLLSDDDLRGRIGQTARRRVEDEHDLSVTLPMLLEKLITRQVAHPS